MTVPDATSTAAPPTPNFIRSFFRHGATYAVASMLSQGIGLLLFPVLAHVFTQRDFGILGLVALATVFVNATIALEVSQGLGRYFAESANEDERRAYASTAL